MPSLHVIYDVTGWAYHRRAEALQKYAPHDWTVTMGSWWTMDTDEMPTVDVVLLLPYGAIRDARKLVGDSLLVSGYNCGVGYRRERLDELLSLSDQVVINNRANWEACGRPDGTTWISNGVDRSVFRGHGDKSRRARAISIGSTYHQRINMDLKGFESILAPITPVLEAAGIGCDWRVVDSTHGPKMSTGEMVEWYNSATIYVVASRHEGTPNPALEAASCGCVLVSTAVGNMPELIVDGVNGRLVERTPEAFDEAILDAHHRNESMATAMQNAIRPWDWEHRSKEYFALFQRLLER